MEDKEDTTGLIILYKDDEAIHRALGLGGGPILQGPNPAASGEDFRRYVYTQLVGGVPDKLMHCVEDARATTGPVTEFFPNIFQRLPRNAYINLVTNKTTLPLGRPMGRGFAWLIGHPSRGYWRRG